MQKDLRPEEMTHLGLNVYQFGHDACASQHSYGPAVRQHYLLHYVLQGGGTLFTETGEWRVGAGEAFLIHPHEITTYTADKSRPWEYMWIELDGPIASRAFESCGLSRAMPRYRAQRPEEREVAQTLGAIIALETHQALRIAGQTLLLLDAMVSHAAAGCRMVASENRHLDKAIAWMERNYQKRFDIADVARYCRIDRSYLSRLFHQQFGYGPKHYLLLLRMSQAVSLLQDKKLPVKVVACSVGYSDQMQFARLFRKVYQQTPSEWRQREWARMAAQSESGKKEAGT